MDIKAERDISEFSLTRKGTFRITTTSGTIPFKIRRLTGSQKCEAIFLKEDDSIHINEAYRKITKKDFKTFTKGGRKSKDLKDSFIERYEYLLEPVRGDVNLLRIATPKGINLTKKLIDILIDILYYTKYNTLFVPPLNADALSTIQQEIVLKAIKERGEIDPKRELVGYLPARCQKTIFEILTEGYLRAGVKIFAIDANNGKIPKRVLGWLNARIETTMDNNYIIMVLGQSDIPKGESGQTIISNDVSSLPTGYDGCAPNRMGFGDKSDNEDDIPERYKKITLKDEKGKKRLFVPYLWGRTQIAGVFDDDIELVQPTVDTSPYNTKALKHFDIIDMFNNVGISLDEFREVVYLHDTELVEYELTNIGQASIEGEIEKMIKDKAFMSSASITKIIDERKEYNGIKKSTSTIQSRITK